MMEQPLSISYGNWVTGCCGVTIGYDVVHLNTCPLVPGQHQQFRLDMGEWVCAVCNAYPLAKADGESPVMTHADTCTALQTTRSPQA